MHAPWEIAGDRRDLGSSTCVTLIPGSSTCVTLKKKARHPLTPLRPAPLITGIAGDAGERSSYEEGVTDLMPRFGERIRGTEVS